MRGFSKNYIIDSKVVNQIKFDVDKRNITGDIKLIADCQLKNKNVTFEKNVTINEFQSKNIKIY